MWIIGIDGGGTKCEAGLFSLDGQLLGSATTGAANLFTDFDGAIGAIEQACERLLSVYQHQYKLNISKKDCLLSLGCAGGGIESVKKAFTDWPHEYAHAALSNDVQVSCLAANNAQACALFVIGTGSCLALNNAQGDTTQVGGHGFLLGDIASGAWLGRLAVSWYLQVLETPGHDKDLQLALGSVLGKSTGNIVQQYGQASAGLFGELVPTLLSVQANSETVQKWLQEGALYVANLLKYHAPANLPIFLSGGLSSVYKNHIETLLNKQVHMPKGTAIYGAFLQGKAHLANHNKNKS